MATQHGADASGAWERLASLPLVIEQVSCSQRELQVRPEFSRITTELQLCGQGETGRGEDPAYFADCQRALPDHFASLPLGGSWTMESFSAHLDTLEVSPGGGWDDHPNFHRWALESAALDLALRQQSLSFAAALGTTQQPLRFCISMGLGSPPSARKALAWLEARPGLEFKLDASNEWDDELCEALAATGAVRVVDIKGLYTGDWIDNTPDPQLYARLARLLPEALLEDPNLRDDTRAALGESGLARVTWDAPLHFVHDLEQLDARPAAVNIKPSRFGALRELLGAIAWCQQRDIPLYAGGQFELGWGRTQAQQLASVFYPDAANDIAPVVWHTAAPGDAVPTSPLDVPSPAGFGFEVE